MENVQQTLCLCVGLLVFVCFLVRFFLNVGRSVDSSSEFTLISSGVFSVGSTASCSTTTLCESGFTWVAFLEILKPLWNLMPQVSWCLDTWEMQSVALCQAWVILDRDIGLKNFSRPVSYCAGTWNLQSVARRLRRVTGFTKFFRNCHIWLTVLRPTQYHRSIFDQWWRLSPFSIRWRAHAFAE